MGFEPFSTHHPPPIGPVPGQAPEPSGRTTQPEPRAGPIPRRNRTSLKVRAEGVGFEPTEPRRVQQFSRLSPSSARPPLLTDYRPSASGWKRVAGSGDGLSPVARGEGGIRTHGTGNPVQQFSRLPPSSTRPPLRTPPIRGGSQRHRNCTYPTYEPRRPSKNWPRIAAHSSASTPDTRSHRWLSRSS